MRDSTTWKIGGTKPFRLGSSKILGRTGGNLQNIEGTMRRVYTADPGKLLIQTDQSGADAAIVAYLARAGRYRQLFQNGIKVHTYIATHLFPEVWRMKSREFVMEGQPFNMEEILASPVPSLSSLAYWKPLSKLIKSSDDWPNTKHPKDRRYYYLGKQTGHSYNYGAQANTVRMNILEKSEGTVAVSAEEAGRFLGVVDQLFPEIKEWHEIVKWQVRQTGMLYNLHGHPYKIACPEHLESEPAKWKEVYSWIPASTVAMITNIAFYLLQEFIEDKSLPWDALINCHDSILSQAPAEQAMDVARKQKEFIEQSFTAPDGTRFKMGSETKVGFNWGSYDEESNPDGLKEVTL